jgi:hypothetical protein
LNGFGKNAGARSWKRIHYFRISAVRAFFTITQKLTFTKDSVLTVQERILNELKGPGADKIYDRFDQFWRRQ